VAVVNPDTGKIVPYGFNNYKNARAFMQEMNKLKVKYSFTHKEEKHSE
jgi:hypothetical protein